MKRMLLVCLASLMPLTAAASDLLEVYRRALARHLAPRWERFVALAGGVDRIAKGRVRLGEEPGDAWLALERLLVAVAEPKAAALLS